MTVHDYPALGELQGLATELRRQLITKRDLMADTRRVSFVNADPDWLRGAGTAHDNKPGTTLQVDMPGEGVESFEVTRHAHGQIAERLGVPWKFYERLLGTQPDLLHGLANGLLNREPERRMIRTMDGKVRAFLSDRYRPRDNWDLLDGAILPELQAFQGPVVFKACELSETRMYVKVVFPDIEAPITARVGDIVRAGVIIQNSEVGAGSLGIFPYTDRLICLNGMVHTDFGQRSRHVGKRIESNEEAWEFFTDRTLSLDDEAFFSKCRDTLRAVLNREMFERIVAQMRDLADIRLPGDPVAQVEVLANRHNMTDGERGSMLSALVEGGDLSAWGMVNAITQTARDHADVDRRVELEALAGNLTADPSSWTAATVTA